MPYRTPALAVQALLDGLQLAVSCVAPDVLSNAGGYHHSEQPHSVFLPRAPVALRAQPPLSFDLFLAYHLEVDPPTSGSWLTRFLGYRYQLYQRDGPELLSYHWHPDDPNPIKQPHLHLGPAAGLQFAALTRAHLPTGIVQLQDFLRLAIEDLGVRPLRPDWREILSGR